MVKCSVIKSNSFKSKSGHDMTLLWVTLPDGLPCKVFTFGNQTFKAGEEVSLVIEPDNNCLARVRVQRVQ